VLFSCCSPLQSKGEQHETKREKEKRKGLACRIGL